MPATGGAVVAGRPRERHPLKPEPVTTDGDRMGRPRTSPIPAPGRRPRRAAATTTGALAVVVAMLLGVGPTTPTLAAASDAWSTPHGDRGVVHGVVVDDDGRPVEDAVVDASATRRVDGGSRSVGSHDTTDDRGRYRIVLVEDCDLLGNGFGVTSRKPGYIGGASGKPDPPTPGWTIRHVRPGAGEVERVDLVMRRRSATVSGRITVRGGAPAGERLQVWVHPEGEQGGLDDVTVHPDGRYEALVPAGPVSVSAQSRFGLPGHWLGPQPGGGPARNRLVVAPDEDRPGVDIELAARLPHLAIDQYGSHHDGHDASSSGTYPPPRYPIDETPHPGSVTGPIARTEPFRMWMSDAFGDAPWLVRGWGFNSYEIPIANDGDDDLWIREVRFEGRDAALFRCEDHGRSWVALPCRAGDVLGHRHGVLRMLAAGTIPIVVDEAVRRDAYEATAVVATNAADSPHRVPMRVADLTDDVRAACAHVPCPPGIEPADSPADVGDPGAAAAATPPTAAPTPPATGRPVVRRARILRSAIRLTRARVRFVLPGAARGRIRIERRRTRGRKRVWIAVRRSSFSTRRAGTVTRRLKALPAGRYRVRLRVTPRGERARTITAIRRTR
ncbi:MAG: hypothetical protein M0P31_00950 [Solirubrobacteraceae bacterium]|nr:hypothetical protein [Solirubrobacteraceae bacterium]